jgi:hypothetical protein
MNIDGSLYVGGSIEVGGIITGISGSTGFTPYDDLSVGTLEISNRLVFTGTSDTAPIRIGKLAGNGVSATNESIAIGNDTGGNAGFGSIAIGEGASTNNAGAYSVAIGYDAGQNGLAANSIAIGKFAATTVQSASSIVLNATGTELDPSDGTISGLFVKPIRNISGDPAEPNFVALYYNPSTGEIGYKS